MAAQTHSCHGTPENTFSALFGDDPKQNLILKKIQHSDVIVEYQIHCPVVARSAQPGQFVIVRGDEQGERIPLTIADFDRDGGVLTLVMQVVGLASHKLDELREGDKFRDIVGPLGHKSEIENFGTVVLVGGGLGIAPVYPIQRALKDAGNNIVSIIGSRSQDLLFWEDRMKATSDEMFVMTDDGSRGEKGLVTVPLQKMIDDGVKIDRVIAIGPPIMMRAVTEVTRPHQDHRQPEFDHGRRHRHVRRLPRRGRRQDEIHLRRRPRIRRPRRQFSAPLHPHVGVPRQGGDGLHHPQGRGPQAD